MSVQCDPPAQSQGLVTNFLGKSAGWLADSAVFLLPISEFCRNCSHENLCIWLRQKLFRSITTAGVSKNTCRKNLRLRWWITLKLHDAYEGCSSLSTWLKVAFFLACKAPFSLFGGGGLGGARTQVGRLGSWGPTPAGGGPWRGMSGQCH